MKLLDGLQEIVGLGGPVVAILFMISVITLGVAFYKIWQFSASGVGRHRVLSVALAAWDAGDTQLAHTRLAESRSYLAPIVGAAMNDPNLPGLQGRIEAEAGLAFAQLERGYRFLDMVAQLTPLLGLFGTVLGMIDAFQNLQTAGSKVDPSLLAGGIWVALMTTAVGLAVAMPTSMFLAWLESRTARERVFADKALQTILVPAQARRRDVSIAAAAAATPRA